VQPLACGPDVRALLLDIEGTTTPLAFVTSVLFPYARTGVRDFLERRGGEPDVRRDLAQLRDEHERDRRAGEDPPVWRGDVGSTIAYVHWLMDRDRKSTGLKALQGRVWDEGFQKGALKGDVYADVPPAFERWTAQGRQIAIFSSGSVLAQKLLFAHTPLGDLTPSIRGFFDTTTGPKKDPDSYRRIVLALGRSPSEVVFLSDVAEELDAARAAGLATGLCCREGEPPAASEHPVVVTFAAVCP
jgi:enolase-phosphatase E1